MTRSAENPTRIIRAWLDEGSTDLSRRVLDGVLRELPATTQDGPSWWPSPRLTTLVALAVATAAVIIAVSAGTRLLPRGEQPGGSPAQPSSSPAASAVPTPDLSYRDVGFIGLPPLGATPSRPETGELVVRFMLPTVPYMGGVHLYADGRMIWNEVNYAAGTGSTGYLEQRLTSEGVELVQSLASGQDGQAKRLDPRRPDMLPASAWADRTIRPFVPSGFGACLILADFVAPWPPGPTEQRSMTMSEKLAELPTAVTELLRDRARVPSPDYGDDADCLGMTTEEARLLDATLRVEGLEQDAWRNGFLLEYHIDLDGDGPENWTLSIWFEPILPDGTISCTSCG